MKGMTTGMNIYEIAKLCGVSSATVSRVINGHADVSEKTRRLVIRTMEENDFAPQTSKVKNNTICLLVDNYTMHQREMASDYISRLIDGISYELFGNGFVLSILPPYQLPNTKQEFQAFSRNHRIAGYICANLTDGSKLYDIVSDQAIPTVFISRRAENERIRTVCADHEKGAYLATSHLLEMGHRTIGFYYAPHIQEFQDRLKGHKRALNEYGIEFQESLLFDYLDVGKPEYKTKLLQLLKDRTPRVTGFIMVNDFEVLRLYSVAGELGLRVPDDLSIIGFDDYDFARFCSPPITTISQPIFDLGANAASLVLRVLKGADPARLADIALTTNLIVRGSVGRGPSI